MATQSDSISVPLIDKLKKIPLPPICVWERAVDKSSLVKAFLDVKIHKLNWLCGSLSYYHNSAGYCVLSKKGYLLVYKDPLKQTGYAFDLTRAKKTIIEKSTGKKMQTKVTIKWKHAKVTLRLDDGTPSAQAQLDTVLDVLKLTRLAGNVTEKCHKRHALPTLAEPESHSETNDDSMSVATPVDYADEPKKTVLPLDWSGSAGADDNSDVAAMTICSSFPLSADQAMAMCSFLSSATDGPALIASFQLRLQRANIKQRASMDDDSHKYDNSESDDDTYY
jgi:hypothetical protein